MLHLICNLVALWKLYIDICICFHIMLSNFATGVAVVDVDCSNEPRDCGLAEDWPLMPSLFSIRIASLYYLLYALPITVHRKYYRSIIISLVEDFPVRHKQNHIRNSTK